MNFSISLMMKLMKAPAALDADSLYSKNQSRRSIISRARGHNMRRSMANFLVIIGVGLYWMIHCGAVIVALHPIVTRGQKLGLYAEESLELPIVGLFLAPLLLLLDFVDLGSAMDRLFITCLGLLVTAAIMGAVVGVTIRHTDPYGSAPPTYVFKVTSCLAALSCVFVLVFQPRCFLWYVPLAALAIPLVTFAFGRILRAIAFAEDNEA
jgi:hypothetical protein